jgi:hypothetical protein
VRGIAVKDFDPRNSGLSGKYPCGQFPRGCALRATTSHNIADAALATATTSAALEEGDVIVA